MTIERPVFMQELDVLRGILLRFALTFFGIVLGVYTLGTPSLALQLFEYMRATLLPAGVTVVALGPLASFTAPIIIAFLVAFLIAFPYLLFLLLRYVLPALYPEERGALVRLFVLALFLFFLGCAFGYFVLIPSTFSVLYSFAAPLGVAPFFSLEAFVSAVFGLTVATGTSFLIPIAMHVLSGLRLVPAQFWRAHWRVALVSTIVLSAIITPDGSGVTMCILSVPLLLLYGVGALFTK
jgi:sec-independent protein translocase protein TatC